MCGIFGYAGVPEFPVDLDKIKVLGMENDSRGGNGCGLLLGDTLHKSVLPPKFTDFIRNKRLTVPTEKQVVLGHCRRATVGAVSVENTHPFQAIGKTRKPTLIGMHNGTVSNWEELCKEVGVEGHQNFQVDSVGLLSLLAHSAKGNFDVLSHYVGAAALAWVYNSSPNTLFLYHGKSKKYKNSAATPVEERPLYYWDTAFQLTEDGELVPSGRRGVYFSSIPESLEKIGALQNEVTELPFNAVFMVKNGKISKVADVDRSASYQDSYTYSGTTYDYSRSGSETKVVHFNSTTRANKKLPDPCIFMKSMEKQDICTLLLNDRQQANKNDGRVYFDRGIYWRDGFPIHSRFAVYKYPSTNPEVTMVDVPFYLETDGTVVLFSEGETRKMEARYFYRGLLCRDKASYDALVVRAEKDEMLYKQDYVNYVHEQQFCIYSDNRASVVPTTPFIFYDGTHKNTTRLSDFAEGDFFPLFSKNVYRFKSGTLVEIVEQQMWNKDGEKKVITSEPTVEEEQPQAGTFLEDLENALLSLDVELTELIEEHYNYLESNPSDPTVIKVMLLKKIIEGMNIEAEQ